MCREQTSSVALGVGQSSGILVLPEALERFRRAWPRTRVRVIDGVPDTLLPLVRQEMLDFMLGADVPGHRLQAAISQRLGECRLQGAPAAQGPHAAGAAVDRMDTHGPAG